MGPSAETSRKPSKQKLQTSTAITVTASDTPKPATPEESKVPSATQIVMQKAAAAARELTRKRVLQKMSSQAPNPQVPATTQIVLQQPAASQYVQQLAPGMQVLQTLPSGVQYIQAMPSGNQVLEMLPSATQALQTGNQAIQYQIVSTADSQPGEGEVQYQVVSATQPQISSGAVQYIVNPNPSISDEAVQYQVVSANSYVPNQGVQYQVVSADPSLSSEAVQYQVISTDAPMTGGAVQYQVVSGGQLMQFVQPQAPSVNQMACWPPTQSSDSSQSVQYLPAGVNATNLQTVMLDQGTVGDSGMQMLMVQMPPEERWCEICQINYQPLTRQEHEKRVSHYKNSLKIKGDAWTRFCPSDSVYCPICNSFVKISAGLKAHEKSARHKHNAELQFLPPSPVEFLQGYCEVCRVKILYDEDQNMMKKHYSSELHSANMGLIGGEDLWVDEHEEEEEYDEETERQETLAYKKWKKRQKKAMQGLHIKKPTKKRAKLTEKQLQALARNSSSGTTSKRRPVGRSFPVNKLSGGIQNTAKPPVTLGVSMPGSLSSKGRDLIPRPSQSRVRNEVNLRHGFGYDRPVGYGRGVLDGKSTSYGRGVTRGGFTGAINNGQPIGFQHGPSRRQGFQTNVQGLLQRPESLQGILPPAVQQIGLQQGVLPGTVNLVGSHQRFTGECGQVFGPSQQTPFRARQIVGPPHVRSGGSSQEIVGPHQGVRAQRIPQSLRIGLSPSFANESPIGKRQGLRSLRTGMRPVVCGIQGPAVSEHMHQPALRPSSTCRIKENIEPARWIKNANIEMPQLALQPSSTKPIKENVEPARKLKATIIEKNPRGRSSGLVDDQVKRKTEINRKKDAEMLEYFQKVDEVSKTFMKINPLERAQESEIGPKARPEGHEDRLVPQIWHQPVKKLALKISPKLRQEKSKSVVSEGSTTISFLPPGLRKSMDLGNILANGKDEFAASEKDIGQLSVGMRNPVIKSKEAESLNKGVKRKSQTAAAKTPTVTSDIKQQGMQQKCTNITAEFRDKPAPSSNQWNPTVRKPKSLSIQPVTGKNEKITTRALKKPIPGVVLESTFLPPGLWSSSESLYTKKVGQQKKSPTSVSKDPPALDGSKSNLPIAALRSIPEPRNIRNQSPRKKSLAVTVANKKTSVDRLDPHCTSPRPPATAKPPGIGQVTKREQKLSLVANKPLSKTTERPDIEKVTQREQGLSLVAKKPLSKTTERQGIEQVTKREQRLSLVVKKPLSNICKNPNPPPPRPKAGVEAIRKVIRLTSNTQISLRTNPPPPRLLRKPVSGASNPPPPIPTNNISISGVAEPKTPLCKPHSTVDVKGMGPQFDDEVSDSDISVGNDDEFDFGDSSSEEFSCEEEFTDPSSPKLDKLGKRVTKLKRVLDRDRDYPNSARNVRMKKNKLADDDSLMDKDVQGVEVLVRAPDSWKSIGGRPASEGYGRVPADKRNTRLGAY